MKPRKTVLAVGGVAVAALSAAALAAAKDSVPELPASFPLGAVVCTLVAVAGVCVVGFKNAKRKQPE